MKRIVVFLIGLMLSFVYGGTIHVHGYTVFPDSSPGTPGSIVQYKDLYTGQTAGNTTLGSSGDYSLDLLVESGINTTFSYTDFAIKAYGNKVIVGSNDVRRIDIYNISGQLVRKADIEISEGITFGSFETGGLSSGIYFINVIIPSGNMTVRTNIFEGQESSFPEMIKTDAVKSKGTYEARNFQIAIIPPSGEYQAFLDTLTFSIPPVGEESWETPIHLLKYNGTTNTIGGYIQKGPFITGSTIQIQELNNDMSPNGTTYNVTTEDNFGTYSLSSNIPADYVEIISTGFYFNEVTGDIADANLTLRSLAAVKDTLDCNVNILTSLAKKRIVYLMNTGGKVYDEARKQAQNEILAIFSITGNDSLDFGNMDISEDGDPNGMLLAVSVILQGDNTVSELSLLVSTIVEDIKTDGILDDVAAKNEIIDNAKYLSLTDIRRNIENRYASLGMSAVIPNFEQYINVVWENQPPTCEITALKCYCYPDTLSVFDGDPLLMGYGSRLDFNTSDTDGVIAKTNIYIDNVLKDSLSTGAYWIPSDTTKFHTIKVVSFDDDGLKSADSINYQYYPYKWVQTSSNETLWDGYGTPATIMAVSFNNKMFVYNVNRGIIYSSINGTDWLVETDSVPWVSYGRFLEKAYDNKIWVIKDSAFWYSANGTDWFQKDVALPEYFYEEEPFIYNGSIHLFFADEIGQIKICKMESDSLVTVSPAIPDLGMPSLVGNVEFNNNLFLYRTDGGTWVKNSQDLVNWTHNSDVFPFDNWSTKMVVFENRIYAFPTVYGPTYVPWMWSSDDCFNWKQDILSAPPLHRVIIFNGIIWAFENDYEFNVYRLKKYFE